MFLLSSAATCRIGFHLGIAIHRNTVGSLEKQEPEWWFWQPLSLSQSFTSPSSLLLLVSLPFLAYSASPRAKSWALVSSPLHAFPQLLCWISARSCSAQSCRRERKRRLWKKKKKTKKTERGWEKLRTRDWGLCCLYYIVPFFVRWTRRIESLVEQKPPRLIHHLQAWSFFL